MHSIKDSEFFSELASSQLQMKEGGWQEPAGSPSMRTVAKCMANLRHMMEKRRLADYAWGVSQ